MLILLNVVVFFILEVEHEATFSVGVSDLLPQSVLPRIVTSGWWLVLCAHSLGANASLEPGAWCWVVPVM